MRRKFYHPNSKQFIRLWIDKNKHHLTNNYRKAHGLHKWSKKDKRLLHIRAFLGAWGEYKKEIGE